MDGSRKIDIHAAALRPVSARRVLWKARAIHSTQNGRIREHDEADVEIKRCTQEKWDAYSRFQR